METQNGGEGMNGSYGRDAKVFCRRCGRRLKTVKSQRKGTCVVCDAPAQWGEPGSRSQFER